MLNSDPSMNSAEWFVPFGTTSRTAPVRLFCLPFAGGSAAIYADWVKTLPSEIGVWGIEPPGRGRRIAETAFDTCEAFADACVHALREQLDRPFALYGHSMGALVGFEVLRRLRLQGRPLPMHFFASGARAPHLRKSDPPIHALPRDAFVRELQAYGGTPPEVLANAELMDLVVPTLRADFALCENYRYAECAPFDVPITGLGGLTDTVVPAEDLRAWSAYSTRFVARMLPGGHFFLRSAQRLLLPLVARTLLNDPLSASPPR